MAGTRRRAAVAAGEVAHGRAGVSADISVAAVIRLRRAASIGVPAAGRTWLCCSWSVTQASRRGSPAA